MFLHFFSAYVAYDYWNCVLVPETLIICFIFDSTLNVLRLLWEEKHYEWKLVMNPLICLSERKGECINT